MTPSAVSKLVARLEARLGARLVNRSTRKLQLTPEGVTFYERSVRVLADLDEAERGASTSAAPRGRLRVNASVPFGTHFLLPLAPEFLAWLEGRGLFRAGRLAPAREAARPGLLSGLGEVLTP